MAKISIIFLVVYAACTFDQTVGLNIFYQANPVYAGMQDYPYISPYAAIWKPDCDSEGNSGESSESSSSESSESSKSSESSESSESKESKESSKSSKESSGESESKGSKESGESKNSSQSSSTEEKEGSSKEEEGESKSKSSEGSSEGSEEKRKETPKKKKKKERHHPLFPPRPYPFPSRQVQRIVYSPTSSLTSSYAYLPYRQASSYVVQQPIVSSYPGKSNIQYMSVPASQTYVRYSPPVVGKPISGPVQKIVYSAAPALSYPSVSKTIIPSGALAYPVAGSWSSPFTYLKK